MISESDLGLPGELLQPLQAATATITTATRIGWFVTDDAHLRCFALLLLTLQFRRERRRGHAARYVCAPAWKPRFRRRRQIRSAKGQTKTSQSAGSARDRWLRECYAIDQTIERARSPRQAESGSGETSEARLHREGPRAGSRAGGRPSPRSERPNERQRFARWRFAPGKIQPTTD